MQGFGESALLTNEPRNGTITVTSETAKTLMVDKASFDMLLGPLEELKKRGKTGTAVVQKVGPEVKAKRFGDIQQGLHRESRHAGDCNQRKECAAPMRFALCHQVL